MGRLHHLHPLLLCLPVLISALTGHQKKLIVDKHNFYRSQAQPGAADMKALSWDPILEELAASYAEKCIWEHNEERGFRGENLFIMSGSGLDVDLGLADWHNEQNFYNFTENSCLEGKMCGHYTQMVWSDTERVGCGEKFCEKMEGFDNDNMYLLVCNYEPPGNFQGLKPYKTGEPCSACPETHSCKGSLCVDVNVEQEESSTGLPDTTSELVPDTSELAPITASELVPDRTELAPITTSELELDTTSVIIPEKQLEMTTTMEAAAKMESHTTPPPLLSESSPPMPSVPGTPTSPSEPTFTSPTAGQILDLTPSSLEDSSLGSPPVPPQVALGDGQSVLPSTVMPHTSYTNSPLSSTNPIADSTVSSKTDRISESISKVDPTTELPSISSPSSLQTTSNQPFANDGPNTMETHSSATVPKMSPTSKKHLEGAFLFVDKDQPIKDSPVQATPKPPMLETKKPNKGQKDKKDPYSDPRNTSNRITEKSKQKSKFPFFQKNDQFKSNFFPKGVEWGFKSNFPERSYGGKHVYGQRFGLTSRSFCPYPCLKPSIKFPLYRTNNVSPVEDQYPNDWAPYKPRAKKPCKPFDYKKGIYSLYLPAKNTMENLTKPKS